MDTRRLFLRTIDDLENKSHSHDWYDMLLIAGLIYKLLYDVHPLVDEVNQSKKKIVFNINNRLVPNDNAIVFYSIEDGIDPETSVPHLARVKQVDRSELYARVVMLVKGEPTTVKELIRFLRNKQGSVHFDDASLTEKDQILKEIQAGLFLRGVNSGLTLMRAIARVVIKGIVPLKDEVIKD